MKQISVLLFAIVLLFSCHKYEDGPSFSLHTKKQRLANKWVFDQVLVTRNGTTTDSTDSFKFTFSNFLLDIRTDGHFAYSYVYQFPLYFYPYGISQENFYRESTWKDENKWTYVYFELPPLRDAPKRFHILRLESHSLWLEYTRTSNNDTVELHLKEQ